MAQNEDEISRTIMLTEQDVVAANQLWARRLRLSRSGWTCPLVGGILLTFLWMDRGHWTGPIAYIAGVIVFTLLFYFVIWGTNLAWISFAARRAFRETAGLRAATDYRMSPDALAYVQADCSATMAWRTLVRWSADERCLLLFNTRLTFYILPSRDFSDEERARIIDWLTKAGVPRF